jgi:hypothetical protein
VTAAETSLSWISRREASRGVSHYLWIPIEEARQYIARAEDAGRIRSRRKTADGWLVSLSAPRCETIDWDTDDDEICLNDLLAENLLRAPKDKAVRRGALTIPMIWSQIIRGEPWDWKEWTVGMHRYRAQASLKLSETLAANEVRFEGQRGQSQKVGKLPAGIFRASKYVGYAVVVTNDGRLGAEPPNMLGAFQREHPKLCKWHNIEPADPDEIERVFPTDEMTADMATAESPRSTKALQEPKRKAAEAPQDEHPGGPVLPKNKGGSPGKWAWDRLPSILKKVTKQGRTFESMEDFEEFCRNNVPLKKLKAKRVEDPELRVARPAIAKFRLADYVRIQLPEADAQ